MELKAFPHVLERLYDGLLDSGRWNEFLAELCAQLDCQSASITFHDSDNHTPTVGFSIGWSQQGLTEWHERYGKSNPRTREILQVALRTGSCVVASSLPAISARYPKSEYVEWLQRYDVYHSLVTSVRCGSGFAALSVSRSRSAKPFTQNGHKLMRHLVPHLQRVLQVHNRNETLRTLSEAGMSALNRLDTGVLAVDERGQIVLANEQAETFLQKGQDLTIRRGKLTGVYSSETANLERLLKTTATGQDGRGAALGGVITVHRNPESAPISVVVTPFRSNRAYVGGRPCALAFICDPTAQPASRAAVLRDLFGLTPAECRLGSLLHAGLELRLAAQRMGVAAATARFMLKRIFSKTGAHRQSELIHLVSKLPGETTSLSGARANQL